jgi:hypothetical protein
MHLLSRPVVRSLVTLMLATASAPALATGPAPAAAPDPLASAIQAAQKRMRDALSQEFPAAEIEVRQEDGAFDTVIAVAVYPKAYPGTGVARVAIDRKTAIAYGARGERSLADFARERRWLETPPETTQLVRFANTLLFDGVAIFDDAPIRPSVTAKDGRLVIETVQRWMPSNSGEVLTITLPVSGPETVARRPLPK